LPFQHINNRKIKENERSSSLSSSSGDHMILAECVFKDSNELATFIKKIEKINGITKICPAIILDKIK